MQMQDLMESLQLLNKKSTYQKIKDCFETFNRATLHLIKGLDKLFLNQLLKVIENYLHQLKTGVSNVFK